MVDEGEGVLVKIDERLTKWESRNGVVGLGTGLTGIVAALDDYRDRPGLGGMVMACYLSKSPGCFQASQARPGRADRSWA